MCILAQVKLEHSSLNVLRVESDNRKERWY